MKLKKICSVFLAVALFAGIVSAASVPTLASSQITSIDFEGSSPYKLTHCKGDDCNLYATIGGDTYLQTSYNQNNIPLFATQNGPYGNGRAAAGISEGWLENTRPTQVSFKLNLGYLSTLTASMDIAGFDPLWRVDATNYNFFRIGFYITVVDKEDRTKDTITLRRFGGNNASVFDVNGEITSQALTVSPVSSLDIANDITVNVKYDWSKFTSENGYALTLEITLTDGNGTSALSTVPLKYRDPTTEVTPDAAEAVTDTKGYSMGFATGNANTAKLAIGFDDIKIWSYNTLNDETYGPVVNIEPKALGYTIATSSDNGNVNLRLGFDFSDAKAAAETNGETITKFGALLVAGTKDADTMKAQLNNALAGNTATGYLFFANDPEKISGGMPSTYTVTIVNSGDVENMGKRATAIAYIVTDKGTYITANSDTEKGIVSGVLNKSSMGLLKDVFTDCYLEDYDAEIAAGATASETMLGKALSAYNTSNSTSYTVENIRSIAVSNAVSTDTQKLLLKELHFELYKAD